MGLTLEQYETFGRLKGAVQRKADAVLTQTLPPGGSLHRGAPSGGWQGRRRRRHQFVTDAHPAVLLPPCLLGQNASMTAAPSTFSSIPIDPRISAIASGIAAAIPEAQVRLFGSRARGTSRPDSDVDLLITVPDQWLAGRDRVRVLGDLWRLYSSHRLPLDLLLYTETEVSQRQQYRSAVTSLAYQEGILLNG